MSYILDALRKSEQERRTNAERSEQREAGIRTPRPPQYASSKRLPLLVGTIFLTIAVIVVLLGMNDNNKPAHEINSSIGSVPAQAGAQKHQANNAEKKKTPLAAKEFNTLPFFWEMPVNYRQEIGALSVSIHVYAQQASRRILFINNREYRAGEQTKLGPRIESIEPQGVILSYKGEYFKLPRPR